jgi:predicted ATP-binding protein involved in virulence
MKINQLEVRNFRGFEHQTFNFSDQFTVLIGENATGKTAILDALVIGAGSLIIDFDGFHWGEVPGGRIQDNDIRQLRYKKSQAPSMQFQFPVEVYCKGVIAQQQITWKSDLEQIATAWSRKLTPEIQEIAEKLQTKVHDGENVLLPLIAYYGAGRLWICKKQEQKTVEQPKTRMRGYIDCLNPRSNLILEWFRTEEISVLQGQESVGIHQAVTAALSSCKIENWQSINYDEQENTELVTDADGRTMPFQMLSDGVRNMVGMVADIAYRAAVLNPQLEIEAAKQTPGIVLIDEIDLHLHPKWQRRVVEDLKATFPAIQFVATTHSPFIVQSLRDGELINLDQLEEPEEYHNKSIEDIAENAMGVEMPQKSERYLEMMEAAEEYYRVMQEAKEASPERLEELKARLDELTIPYSDDPAYQAFLKMEREAAGIGSGEKNETD